MFVKFAEHPPVGVKYRIKTLVSGYVKSLENIDSVKYLNIRRNISQHLKRFSYCLAAVFGESLEAKC